MMYSNRVLLLVLFLVATGGASARSAEARVAFRRYVAATDDIAGNVRTFGQLLVHRAHRVPLTEGTGNIPVLGVQFAGPHHRQTAAQDPNHAAARAKCIAERLVHAWTLMDHGATLEIGADDWGTYALHPDGQLRKHVAVLVRTPVPGEEPLRILTVYPEDMVGYPWIHSDRSLAEYLAALIQAHYLLFWKNESNLGKYADLRIARTVEGRIFREIAAGALDAARARGRSQIDADAVNEALKTATLAQRETLCRLAIVPPMDWQAAP